MDCFTTRRWTQSHHKDGDKIILHELTAKDRLISFAEELILEADHHVFRGWLFGNGPEFLWKVPVGRAKYDDDDPEFLENSVNGKLFDFGNWLMRKTMRYEGRTVMELDITPEQAAKLWPDAAWLILDNDDL